MATLTPLERDTDHGDNLYLTPDEAREIAEATATRRAEAYEDSDVNREAPPGGGDGSPGAAGNVGGYNNFWFDRGAGVVDDRRTSLIVEPADGRVPSLQPGFDMVQLSLGEDLLGTRPVRVRAAGIGADSWEDRGLAERCLVGFNSGPPIVPAGYNQNLQVLQTPTEVVLVNEMVHSTRVIPLDGRPHVPDTLRQWMGDSRGHWDGDTLVVETTNFLRETSFRGGVTTGDLHLVERFTRMSDGTMMYRVTVEDPNTWDQPWTYQIPMVTNTMPLYEYACHEGNYGLYNILAGAREEEATAEANTRD